MFAAALGLSVALALPSPALKLLLGLAAVGVSVYMASKGYDCARDSVDGRIAAVTDRFSVHRFETGSTEGMRILVTLRGMRFWVPTRAIEALDSPMVTIYFTPRARVVINIEPAVTGGDA